MQQNQGDTEKDKKAEKIATSRLGYLGWGLWIVTVIFFGQNTWASMYENEPRAAMIYAAFTILLLMGGGIVYMSRKYRYFY